MDESKVKAIVEREIEPLMEAVGVPHWKITVSFGLCDDRTCAAACNVDPAYNIARIVIDPSQHDDEEEVLDSLLHELLHVVLSPFDIHRRHSAAKITVDTAEGEQERRLWEYVVEQGVINLKRMWTHSKAYHAKRDKPKPAPKKRFWKRS